MRKIEYEPQNIKDLFKQIRDLSELMVDLSYSAVLFDDHDIADEVLRIEKLIDVLEYHVRISAMLGARRVEEAEQLSGVLQIAGAAQKMSNAAGDIAKIVLNDIGIPIEFKCEMRKAEETVVRVTVSPDSEIAGRTLGEMLLETETGMRVIAIRRGHRWIYGPKKDARIMAEDTLFAKGHDEGVPIFYKMATGREYRERADERHKGIQGLERAVELIIDMKNISELAVGLAVSAILFNNEEIAHEVTLIETSMDEKRYELERWVLETAQKIEDVEKLMGILHLAFASESISDAADEIADVVLRDIELHPVIAMAIRESDEIITRIRVSDDSPIVGRTLGELEIETETGMYVLAIRGANRWIYHPKAKTVIQGGDLLYARGTRAGENALNELCSSSGSD